MDRPRAARPPETPLTARLTAGAARLRCQWCGATLPAEAARCASCGSPGIPDPRLASASAVPAAFAEPVVVPEPLEQPELVEWWRDDDENGAGKQQLTLADVERRRMQTFVAMGLGVTVCVFVGWLAGPLLAPILERLTGSTVEQPSDLRGMGAFLGFLAGMFFGATSGWIIWSGG